MIKKKYNFKTSESYRTTGPKNVYKEIGMDKKNSTVHAETTRIGTRIDPWKHDDASPMSSYRCMLRPTWMFMDRMIAPINVQSIS